jgi:hypothetical protein
MRNVTTVRIEANDHHTRAVSLSAVPVVTLSGPHVRDEGRARKGPGGWS